ICETLREFDVGPAVSKQRRAGDDLTRAGGQHVARALDGPDAAADSTGERRRDLADDRQVVAGPHCRVEVDDLRLREPLEAAHPLEDVLVAYRETLALDELYDGAGLKVDGRDQHQRRTGMPPARRWVFRFFTLVSA